MRSASRPHPAGSAARADRCSSSPHCVTGKAVEPVLNLVVSSEQSASHALRLRHMSSKSIVTLTGSSFFFSPSLPFSPSLVLSPSLLFSPSLFLSASLSLSAESFFSSAAFSSSLCGSTSEGSPFLRTAAYTLRKTGCWKLDKSSQPADSPTSVLTAKNNHLRLAYCWRVRQQGRFFRRAGYRCKSQQNPYQNRDSKAHACSQRKFNRDLEMMHEPVARL